MSSDSVEFGVPLEYVDDTYEGVCAEIQYRENRNGEGPVHSDLCPTNHEFSSIDAEMREMYHRCLDEWLNNSKGTGHFFIGDARTIRFIPSEDEKAALQLINEAF